MALEQKTIDWYDSRGYGDSLEKVDEGIAIVEAQGCCNKGCGENCFKVAKKQLQEYRLLVEKRLKKEEQ